MLSEIKMKNICDLYMKYNPSNLKLFTVLSGEYYLLLRMSEHKGYLKRQDAINKAINVLFENTSFVDDDYIIVAELHENHIACSWLIPELVELYNHVPLDSHLKTFQQLP